MKLTTNYSLKKPEGSDVVNIDDFNYNADMIDSAIQEIKNTSSTNKTNISSLQTRVDNGQSVKLTEDAGVCKLYTGQDLNELKYINSFYRISQCSNVPPTTHGWGYVEVLVHNPGVWAVQTLIDLHNSTKRWTRHLEEGIWSEWREL